MNRLQVLTWLRSLSVPVGLALFILAGAVAGAVFVMATGCAARPTPAQFARAESDLCKARAAYKLVAFAAGGALDPKPGSPRATLEAAEDALCSEVVK